MSLLSQLQSDIKESMKSKQKEKLQTIRLVISAIKNKEIETKKELTDEEVLALIQREIKQTNEELDSFKKVGNTEKVEVLEDRLNVLKAYLPKQLTEEEIKEKVQSVITENNFSDIKDMGKVMGKIKPLVQGKADMSVVSKVVKELLQ